MVLLQCKRQQQNNYISLYKSLTNGRLQQLIEFFGQVTKEDLEWRFPP